MSTVVELAERAKRNGWRLCRWTDPEDPLALESVVYALRAKGGGDVRVGSARDVARLLDALEARATPGLQRSEGAA